MRAFAFVTALAALSATPAHALQIVQVLPVVQTLGDFTPFDITGALFNPALGPLTGVTGELAGTVQAIEFRSLGPFPTTRLTTRYFLQSSTAVGPGPNRLDGTLPDQTITPTVTGGGQYTGAATPVDIVFTFGNPADFIGPPSPPALLALFGFRANTPDLTTPTGGASDLTTFEGRFTLTYTYGSVSVPEPSSILMLSLGLFAFAAGRKAYVRRGGLG